MNSISVSDFTDLICSSIASVASITSTSGKLRFNESPSSVVAVISIATGPSVPPNCSNIFSISFP